MSDIPPSNDVTISLEELVGCHVLVGLTVEDDATGAATLEQFHGKVTWVDPKKGIGLDLLGNRLGDCYVLPPDTRSFGRAPAGDYRLRGTGEVVTNPDFLTTWTVVRPAPKERDE